MADFPDYGDRSVKSLVPQEERKGKERKEKEKKGLGSKVANSAGTWAGKAFNAASSIGDGMAEKTPHSTDWLMDRIESIEVENIKRRAQLDEKEKRIDHLLNKVMKEVEANGDLQETIQQGLADALRNEQNRKKAAQWWGLIRDVTICGISLVAVVGVYRVSGQLKQLQEPLPLQGQGYQQQQLNGSPWRGERGKLRFDASGD